MQEPNREQFALATLRERIAEVERTNGELLAFARGHTGAANAIHEAVLAIMDAETPAAVAMTITREWPALLGVDVAALAWASDGLAIAADQFGHREMEPRLVVRMAGMDRAVTVRQVDQGHPLFGEDGETIRAEIAIRLAGAHGVGLIMLGEREAKAIDAPAASRLLRFLGRSASTMLERWPLRSH